MREELISFETAKLAKEKGFNEYVLNHYSEFETLNGVIPQIFQDDVKNSELELIEYSAPTQSLLQKWIYETSGYWIDIHRRGLKFRVGIESMNTGNSIWSNDTDYNEPEEALEKGLQEALKLIK